MKSSILHVLLCVTG
jgi:hypothetical protein